MEGGSPIVLRYSEVVEWGVPSSGVLGGPRIQSSGVFWGVQSSGVLGGSRVLEFLGVGGS